MNTPISFELAKLLKEKGYDEEIHLVYDTIGDIDDNYYFFINSEMKENISAPTIADVVMWLYEKHGVWIRVTPIPYSENLTHWRWEHMSTNYTTRNVSWKKQKDYLSPTEAYEAAIEYILKNLI